jgi:hypothetical protein
MWAASIPMMACARRWELAIIERNRSIVIAVVAGSAASRSIDASRLERASLAANLGRSVPLDCGETVECAAAVK